MVEVGVRVGVVAVIRKRKMRLVPTEDRKCKCRRFEKGLHSFAKRLVMSNCIRKFAKIVESARGLELPKNALRGTKAWEPRQPFRELELIFGELWEPR